ncbi:ComF family protein [Hydrogenimonas urashimensis]|uniref:ComF family protein n=1 Tax=Hydrogenimonas urashimensis TaxID=2740515 RepID=UPI00191640F9|nr:ComF family protein [Hydrogenimonas urashimensis]
MRCHSCRRFSLSLICQTCRRLYLRPEPSIRTLPSGLKVISLFGYDEIEPFLLTKHHPHGWFIYRILAKEAFAALERAETLYAIAIDDDASGGYSHTALLAKALAKRGYRPLLGVMRAQNRISYSGQSREFRLANPRRFRYRGPEKIDAVLIDDIVTTGLTLQEAQGELMRHGVNVGWAIVLADVDR